MIYVKNTTTGITLRDIMVQQTLSDLCIVHHTRYQWNHNIWTSAYINEHVWSTMVSHWYAMVRSRVSTVSTQLVWGVVLALYYVGWGGSKTRKIISLLQWFFAMEEPRDNYQVLKCWWISMTNRMMYRIGTAARLLKLLECDFIIGIPLTAAGKNPFFDRNKSTYEMPLL